jgi:5-methylcytosine-specific restriction endonuclease McrA
MTKSCFNNSNIDDNIINDDTVNNTDTITDIKRSNNTVKKRSNVKSNKKKKNNSKVNKIKTSNNKKSSMLRIKNIVGKPLETMKQTITQTLNMSSKNKYSAKTNIEQNKNNANNASNTTKRRKLPYGLRYNVWQKYNGDVFNAKCYVDFCNQIVNPFTFEVGHDIPASKGGSNSITNLRPICRNCNNSMSNVYTITEYSKLFK